jgi:hypothetical protein
MLTSNSTLFPIKFDIKIEVESDIEKQDYENTLSKNLSNLYNIEVFKVKNNPKTLVSIGENPVEFIYGKISEIYLKNMHKRILESYYEDLQTTRK